MSKISIGFLLVFATLSVVSAQPGTEIYLFDLKITRYEVTLTNPRNISNNPGYDNQPFFHPKRPLLFYVSAGVDDKTDIMEYNYETKETRTFAQTPDREYSPTVTPDKKFISCIIQRDSGAQDLGKFPVGGGEPEILINNLMVGYHAWADDNNVLIFVLGEPSTLRWYSVREKKEVVLAENIGRSLHRIPGTNSVSFIHKVDKDRWLIKKVDDRKGITTTIGETLKGREFLTWTTGKILMSDESKIFFRNLLGDPSWQEAGIESAIPLKTITRLAVNLKNSTIAVVVNE